ncbi:hypothetical protein HY605_02040 [Candidatus Peregrinibacteria bacterium]|nr:hypothetical protein [Candidatus Peregrinibacteria bacterium]
MLPTQTGNTAYAEEPAATCTAPFVSGAGEGKAPDSICIQSGLANQAAYEAVSCPADYGKSLSQSGQQADGTYTLTCIKNIVAGSGEDALDLLKKVEVLKAIQGTINRLFWPILVLIGSLMDNSLLFGSGMAERLQDIWIPIRNLVNILFVVVLVGLALYNVLGLGDENSEYSIKAALPKLIVGIIAVNFSFLGIKVFLDATNVLTTSIFNLPNSVSEGLGEILPANADGTYTDTQKEKIKKLCAQLDGISPGQYSSLSDETLNQQRNLLIYQKAAQAAGLEGFQTTMSVDQIKSLSEDPSNTAKKADFDNKLYNFQNGGLCEGKDKLSEVGMAYLRSYNSRNAAFALALNMGNVVFYEDIPIDSASVEKLLINSLFSMLMYIIFAASFIAMFIVLLARLVVMWLSIVVSPVLILMMASSTVKEKLGTFGELTDKFFKHATTPIMMALSMTIGWIMLQAIQELNVLHPDSQINVDPTFGLPIVGLSTIQDFVVALGTIAVVWMGVFESAKGTIAETATDWMRENIKKAGSYLATVPLRHIPAVPVTKNGESTTATIGELLTTAEDITNPPRQDRITKWLGIGTGAKPEDILQAPDKNALFKSLSDAKNDLGTKPYADAVEQWKSRHRDAFNGLGADEKSALNGLIAAGKSGDQAALTAAANKIKGLRAYKDAEVNAAKTGAAAGTAGPTASGISAKVTSGFNVDNRQSRKIETNISNVLKAKNATEAAAPLAALKAQGVTYDNLRAITTPEQLAALQGKAGSEAALQTALNGAAGLPPKAAAPAGPAPAPVTPPVAAPPPPPVAEPPAAESPAPPAE